MVESLQTKAGLFLRTRVCAKVPSADKCSAGIPPLQGTFRLEKGGCLVGWEHREAGFQASSLALSCSQVLSLGRLVSG